MKREIAIGIAATSLLSATAFAEPSQDKPDAPKAQHGGGKCASGKCGTEKIYAEKQKQAHPDGTLVRARDGKCGPTGQGYKATATARDRLAEGTCGN